MTKCLHISGSPSDLVHATNRLSSLWLAGGWLYGWMDKVDWKRGTAVSMALRTSATKCVCVFIGQASDALEWIPCVCMFLTLGQQNKFVGICLRACLLLDVDRGQICWRNCEWLRHTLRSMWCEHHARDSLIKYWGYMNGRVYAHSYSVSGTHSVRQTGWGLTYPILPLTLRFREICVERTTTVGCYVMVPTHRSPRATSN